MPPDRKLSPDVIRVQHMIDAIEEALSFIAGKQRHDLDGDRMRTLSLIKEIEILGEAASKISKDFQDRHNNVPWLLIVGMRNRLIHGYFEVDLDVVWKTVLEDLPDLLAQLKTTIKPEI